MVKYITELFFRFSAVQILKSSSILGVKEQQYRGSCVYDDIIIWFY